MADRAAMVAAFPADIPAAFKPQIEKLSARSKEIMNSKGLAYSIMADYAARSLTSLEDISDRFDSPELAKNHLNQTGFVVGHNGITDSDVATQAIKIKQLTRAAQNESQVHPEIGSMSPRAVRPNEQTSRLSESITLEETDRKDIEAAYRTCWGTACPGIRHQVVLSTLKVQYGKCQKGFVGSMHSKYIIPHCPESGEDSRSQNPRLLEKLVQKTRDRYLKLPVRLTESGPSGKTCSSCALPPSRTTPTSKIWKCQTSRLSMSGFAATKSKG